MHEVSIPKPGFGFAADLAVLTWLIFMWDERSSIIIALVRESASLPMAHASRTRKLTDVLDDCRGLGEDQGLRGSCSFNGQDRCFPQRVNLLKLRRRKHVLSFVRLELIWNFQLFQQPEYTV
jgi:hypothetical protein